MNPIVQLQGVSKRYGEFAAVDGMNLQVSKGEVFGFLGPNGAGKSTTLRMILSLIRPTTGSISLFGLDLGLHRNSILGRIGCIVEKPDFYLYLSGLDNLRLFGRMSQTRHLNERIETVLHLVGLKGREKDRVKTYSHGMKQRLGLAQALLHDPELIILDEPSTGLDPQGIIELRNLILHLKNDLGKTVILSSHILSEIEMIADSMVIIHRGKAVVQGKVAGLLSHEDLQVAVQVDNPLAAEKALTESRLGGLVLERSPGVLKLRCAKDEIPQVVRILTDKKIAIFGLQATRSLEDYFLRITAAPEMADIMAFK